MNKMQMAHEYAKTLAANPVVLVLSDEDIVDRAWQYADAMQAKADEREDKTRPEVLGGWKKGKAPVRPFFKPSDKKEWQPDWSQAPEWANWWAMDGDKDAYWHSCVDSPIIDVDIFQAGNPEGHTFSAPSFNYQGNWQDSLRKRPQ